MTVIRISLFYVNYYYDAVSNINDDTTDSDMTDGDTTVDLYHNIPDDTTDDDTTVDLYHNIPDDMSVDTVEY